MQRLAPFAFVFALLSGKALANPVAGKLELPAAPKHAPPAVKGFIDRLENPKKPVQDANVGSYMLVVLEGDAKPEAPGQVTWDLVGESFARPVVGAPIGADVVIKNCKVCPARTLTAVEDPKLLAPGPINPTGPKSFRVPEPRVYTIVDKDAPHLVGRVVGVATPFIATVDHTGRFDFPDVPEGTYKLRIFYKTNWIDRPDDTVTVAAKGKTDLGTVKVPAGYPLKK
jgi:hypothetical protein